MAAPNEPLSIRSALARKLPELRPSEQRVASFLLYAGADTADWRLESLAKEANVSPSAVVRMCRALGFSGFRPFRDRWFLEHSDPTPHTGTPLHNHPLKTAIEALHHTAALLDPALLERAGELVCSAETVLVYGQGISGHVARTVAASLTVTGRLAVALSESESKGSPLPVDDGTVLVVISHRGTNPSVCQFTQQCKKQGATTIIVTSVAKSPLSELADVLLLTGAPVEDDREALELSPARVVQMAVLQALVHASRRFSATKEVQSS